MLYFFLLSKFSGICFQDDDNGGEYLVQQIPQPRLAETAGSDAFEEDEDDEVDNDDDDGKEHPQGNNKVSPQHASSSQPNKRRRDDNDGNEESEEEPQQRPKHHHPWGFSIPAILFMVHGGGFFPFYVVYSELAYLGELANEKKKKKRLVQLGFLLFPPHFKS